MPPDPYANNQKIFVPRSSLMELVVLGVIGNPQKTTKKRAVAAAVSKEQGKLFGE